MKLLYCLAPVSKLSEAVEPTTSPVKEYQVILFGVMSYIAADNGLLSNEIADKSKS